jgi:two-component system response regulator DegU
MKKILIAIICRQPLLRAGMEHSLSKTSDMELLQTTDFDKQLLSTKTIVLPDVIVVNIDDYSDDSFEIVRKIKKQLPNIGIIVVSNNNDDAQIFQAIKSQASAFISTSVTTDEMIDIIRRVSLGEYPINDTFTSRPGVASQVVEQFQGLMPRNDELQLISPLTLRETEVLNCISEGLANKQIAAKMDISEQTIKTHITSILRKLNANTRTEALIQAIKQGLISIS